MNFRLRLDEILFNLCDLSYASFTTQEETDRVADQLDYDRYEAKRAITSLIKELVAEAKPKNNWLEGSDLFYGQDEGVGEFEQNLLKALEEK